MLTKYNGETITYDEIGNPINYRDGITMTWQNGRELKSLSKDGKTYNFTYDPSGLRTKKSITTSSDSTTNVEYIYEGGQLMQMTYGERIFDFSYDAGGNPIGFKYTIPSASVSSYYYYGLNSRGDVEALYTSTGSISALYEYDAYGKLLSVKNSNGTEITGDYSIAHLNPLRYRGYVYDTETGLYYLQSRYYDPTTCRFINADVFYETGQGINGYNMFAYCNNNPVIFADYYGTDAMLLIDREAWGHLGLLIEDENGDWYHFYYGAPTFFKGVWSTVKPIQAETWCIKYDGGLDLDSINENKYPYPGTYSDYIWLYGDFSDCLEQFNNPSESYDLNDNNCSQYVLNTLSSTGSKYTKYLSAAADCVMPVNAFDKLVETVPTHNINDPIVHKLTVMEKRMNH